MSSTRTYAVVLACFTLAGCRINYDDDRAPVTVQVVNIGSSMWSYPVFFDSADGTLLGMAATNLDGNATFDIPPNSMVSVVHPGSNAGWTYIRTRAGVDPGICSLTPVP